MNDFIYYEGGVLCYKISISIPFIQNKLNDFDYAKDKKEVNYD